ncbi:MAG: hypothetical protein HC876_19360 [Chloroflexaceae bacterium]|nr:hypothetical protein [Chloroflexaceae bacterium]NJO07492.1 hypothetical protein [Chloroflexaceae bacterium]
MTTEWNTRATEMVKMWSDSQQKMWENWLGAMRGMTMTSPTANREMWEKSVDVWQDSIQMALDTQVTWTQFWADSIVTVSGNSQQVNDWSSQTLEMSRQWTARQKELWTEWFKALKTADMATMMKTFSPDEMMKMMQTWQESAQKMMEAQMEMARTITGVQLKNEA